MRKWLRQNSKLKKSSGTKHSIFQWSIPAFRVRQGQYKGDKTCPMAGECGNAGGCYALQGAYVWPKAKDSHTLNYELSRSESFVSVLSKEIGDKAKRLDKQGKTLVVRIHDAGDFYSLGYARKWFQIIEENPSVIFYAYTKMVKLFKALDLPTNLTIIFSEGGTQDSHITGRHSRVFGSIEELNEAGYDNASEDDKVAFLSGTGLIGLVYHGAKSKQWTTKETKHVDINQNQVAG